MGRPKSASKKRKKSANGTGTVRKLSTGRFEARYTAIVDAVTGQKKQKSKTFDSEQEARIFLANITRENITGGYILPSDMLLKDWLIIYLQTYVVNLKESSRRSYEDRIRLHIIPELGHVKLCNLTPIMVQQFINGLYRKKGNRKALSPKTVKSIHGVLHAALKKAVKAHHIPINPADEPSLQKITLPEITPLTDAQTVELLKKSKSDRYYHIYFLCLFTGIRQGEALGLTWDCIDWDNNVITINKQLLRKRETEYISNEDAYEDGLNYRLGSVKNDHARPLPVGEEVMNVLRLRYEEQQKEKERAQDLWFEPIPGLVFENEFGKNLSHTTVRNHFKKIVTEIGLPQERFHNMRHNYTAAAYEGCHDLTAVQKSLGHATPDFTMRVYDRITETRSSANAQGMDNRIKNLKEQMK